MKYLKTYTTIFESLSFKDKIADEAASLGFTYNKEISAYELIFHGRYIIYITYSCKLYVLFPRIGSTYIDSLVEPEVNLYLDYSPVKRSLALVQYILDYKEKGEEIDSNEEFKDILTNYLDKGYDLIDKRWGFLQCNKNTIGSFKFHEFVFLLGQLPNVNSLIRNIEWKYGLYIKYIEDGGIETIEKDFNIFNSYLEMIGLKAEYITDSKSPIVGDKIEIIILIDKI